MSLYGPHREDFEFMFAGKSLREFGSRGQQRIGALIYKLAQWEYLAKQKNITPILLIDDIFSELDKSVCKKIGNYLSKMKTQTVLSLLDTKEIDKLNLEDVNMIKL